MQLFPRLPLIVAHDIASKLQKKSVRECCNEVAFEHEAAVYAPTGGTRVEPGVLVAIREAVVAVAKDNGYPDGGSVSARANFDCLAARVLYELMAIHPGEASRAEVWSFLTCLVLPDVAVWRFPGSENRNRFTGGARNTFQRLWWRSEALLDPAHDDPYHLLEVLNEDALVQIMERPILRASGKLARSMARCFGDEVLFASPKARESGFRLCVKKVRQLYPVVDFEFYDEALLDHFIADVFREVVAGLEAADGPLEIPFVSHSAPASIETDGDIPDRALEPVNASQPKQFDEMDVAIKPLRRTDWSMVSRYSSFEGEAGPDPREAPLDLVAAGLHRVIVHEGPMVVKRAYDLYLRGCGIGRMGKELQKSLNQALLRAIQNHGVLQEDESGKGGFLYSTVRAEDSPPVMVRERGPRSFEEIPPSELQMVARRIARDTDLDPGSADHFRAILEHFELKRLTTQVEDRLRTILEMPFPYVEELLDLERSQEREL